MRFDTQNSGSDNFDGCTEPLLDFVKDRLAKKNIKVSIQKYRIEKMVNEKKIKDLEVNIYGGIGLPEHQSYLDSLIEFVQNAGLDGVIKFQGELDYNFVDEAYEEASLFVNLSQTGSLDKTVLEAAASGTVVLTSNEAFEAPLKKIDERLFFLRDNPEDLAKKITQMKQLTWQERVDLGKRLRQWVETNHNLKNLAGKIITEFSR